MRKAFKTVLIFFVCICFSYTTFDTYLKKINKDIFSLLKIFEPHFIDDGDFKCGFSVFHQVGISDLSKTGKLKKSIFLDGKIFEEKYKKKIYLNNLTSENLEILYLKNLELYSEFLISTKYNLPNLKKIIVFGKINFSLEIVDDWFYNKIFVYSEEKFRKCNIVFFESVSEETVYWCDRVNNINELIRPKDPKKEGFIFKGWFIDKECITKFNFNKDLVLNQTFNEDGSEKLNPVKIYPKWEQK